jgi:uncharacterized membrane protein YeiB
MNSRARPIAANERIVTIDVVRGFALLGFELGPRKYPWRLLTYGRRSLPGRVTQGTRTA